MPPGASLTKAPPGALKFCLFSLLPLPFYRPVPPPPPRPSRYVINSIKIERASCPAGVVAVPNQTTASRGPTIVRCLLMRGPSLVRAMYVSRYHFVVPNTVMYRTAVTTVVIRPGIVRSPSLVRMLSSGKGTPLVSPRLYCILSSAQEGSSTLLHLCPRYRGQTTWNPYVG